MIKVENVTKTYAEKTVLEKFSLLVKNGERTAVMAPSGSGKTTLLRLISGLEKPDSGSIEVNGKTAYVFQEPTLLKWMTALENAAAVKDGSEENAARLLLEMGFDKDDLKKYPDELSGGMQQRVSVARALNFGAENILLDEAFKGLDEKLKQSVINTVRRESEGKALILVTHSEEEAETLCEKIIKL